jgi:arsenate reductase (glutaredoxin)
VRDFFKQPFTADELRALFRTLNLAPRDALSTKSPAFRALNLAPEKLSEARIIALMVQEPRLIKRPLMVIAGKPVIGFDKTKLNEVLE